MNDAQIVKNVTWVVGEAGCGKTTTAKLYASEYGEVFYILCSEDMKKSDFYSRDSTPYRSAYRRLQH